MGSSGPAQAWGQVVPHKCLWEIGGPEAAQVRLAMRLRTRAKGQVVEFDRMPHEARSTGVEG